MKNLKRLLFFYAALLSFSVIIQSCCEQKLRIIGSGSMELRDTSFIQNDTITSAFSLFITPSLGVASNRANASLINSSYAFQCAFEFQNTFDLESIVLSCDKDFQYGNERIRSGTNFIKQEGINATTQVDKGRIDLYISLDSTFVQNTTFAKEIYTFQVDLKTDDDIAITSSASSYMDL